MKQSLLLGISLLAVAACAPQAPPPPAAPTSMAQPVGAPPGGSPSNTTIAFDGVYDGGFIQNMSTGRTTAECPDLRVAPALTIRNGLAQFQAANMTFQGYVTPQGGLTMQSERGQTFGQQAEGGRVSAAGAGRRGSARLAVARGCRPSWWTRATREHRTARRAAGDHPAAAAQRAVDSAPGRITAGLAAGLVPAGTRPRLSAAQPAAAAAASPAPARRPGPPAAAPRAWRSRAGTWRRAR